MLIYKAFICFLTLTLAGCSLNQTQTDSTDPSSTDPQPVAEQEHAPSAVEETSVSEPEPIEEPTGTEITEVTEQPEEEVGVLPEEQDLWLIIRDELQFDRHVTQRTVKERIGWFVRNQDYLDRVADRAQPYLFHIIQRLKERDMPLDLALLPIVESAYNPFAYSPSHASGIWQFIPSTGRLYGLKLNWWYDGRRDIIAATEAALDYLEMLHKRFNGNWFHALAAYNTGEGNVERSIRRNKRAGKKTDFWSLRLPRETRGYVPSLLAVAEVLKNHDDYNIRFKPIANKPYFESIDVGSQIDLATVSELSGLSIDEVYTLNPGFNRYATGPNGPHRILVPIENAQEFETKLAAVPELERISWKRHKIRAGESLSRIASRYNTSVAVLKQANRLRGNLIRAGHSLLIPSSKKSSQYYSLSADARRFKSLKRSGDGTKYIYTVKRGDTLWDIGRHYGISVRQLVAWNGISRKSFLRPGQKLSLWINNGEDNQSEGKMVKVAAEEQPEDVSYVVKRGDSLWLIAKRFSVQVKDLLEWNGLKKGKHLQPGQTLIVQQNVSGT